MKLTGKIHSQIFSVLISAALLLILFILPGFAQQIDMNKVNQAVSEAEKALAGPPAPPEGIDTKQAVQAANELGILAGSQGTYVVVGEGEAGGDSTSPRQDSTFFEPNDSSLRNEPDLDPKISNLGEPDKPKEPKKEVAATTPKAQGIGSPGIYFVSFVQKISAQECMERAKAAFISEGMTIGNGDYWWYGAVEPRFHSYNNCIDLGNGSTLVNFTTASWTMEANEHLGRLTRGYNAPLGTLLNKIPYPGEVQRPLPELYMWVQMKTMSQAECIRRAKKALKSEGLSMIGSDVWWAAAADGRFNTYITCTDLGNGNVYVNVTSTSSQSEDIAGHRDRITSQFN